MVPPEADPVSCEGMDLGSELGADVVDGTLDGSVGREACSEDLGTTYVWTAPATATYAFETDNPDVLLATGLCEDGEAVVYCTGSVLQPMEEEDRILLRPVSVRETTESYRLSVREAESACDDTMDNDGDGDVDCVDADCQRVPGCFEEVCDDGEDDDGDGDVDCDDPDCSGHPDCTESECDDGMDDDEDGDTDCDDADCRFHPGCTETECDNGMDDDGDGDTDCDDVDCTRACVTE